MSLAEGNFVSTPKFVAFVIGFLVLIALLVSDDDGFIFIIDHANLLFHEAGHLIFGLFGATMGLYGGTLGQLAIPIICGVAFWWQKSWVSVSVVSLWFLRTSSISHHTWRTPGLSSYRCWVVVNMTGRTYFLAGERCSTIRP